jgi:hypothetical protein
MVLLLLVAMLLMRIKTHAESLSAEPNSRFTAPLALGQPAGRKISHITFHDFAKTDGTSSHPP